MIVRILDAYPNRIYYPVILSILYIDVNSMEGES